MYFLPKLDGFVVQLSSIYAGLACIKIPYQAFSRLVIFLPRNASNYAGGQFFLQKSFQSNRI
nr:MAG TPA: hypothetical protein [Caudoviricetes sp.]